MSEPPLFRSCRLGGRDLAHRVVLAPMTRTRACSATLAPTRETALYYAQRASPGGLLITEATHISPEATPIWTIYSAVRDAGGHVPRHGHILQAVGIRLFRPERETHRLKPR